MRKQYSHRVATMDDIPIVKDLMDRAIYELQKDFLDEAQLQVAHQTMGLDTTLIEDCTYFLILNGESSDKEAIVGCGGWGKRATLYGGNHTAGRSAELLDPNVDRARIRAMYCDPNWARQGVGSYTMEICQQAARDAGFNKMTLGSTLAGQALYEHYGFKEVERRMEVADNGVEVPVITMIKDL